MSEKPSLIKRSLLYVPVGAIVTYILLSIVLGSASDTFILMGASIICTLGISLVIWLPLWYGVGYIVMLLYGLLTRPRAEPDAQQSGVADKPSLTNDQRALVDYIRKAAAKGFSREKITENLRNNGWTGDNIDWAFTFVGSSGNS